MPAPTTGTYIDQPAADTPAEDSPTAEVWRTTTDAISAVDHKWPHVLADALDDDDAPVGLRADADGRLRIASTTGAPIIVAPHEAAMDVEVIGTVTVTPVARDIVRVASTTFVSAASSAYTVGDVLQGDFVFDDILAAPGDVHIRGLSLYCNGDPVFAANTEVDLWLFCHGTGIAGGMDNDAWDGAGTDVLVGVFRATGANYGLHCVVDVVYPCAGVDMRIVPVLAAGSSPTFAGSEDLVASIVLERL